MTGRLGGILPDGVAQVVTKRSAFTENAFMARLEIDSGFPAVVFVDNTVSENEFIDGNEVIASNPF